MRTDIRCWLLLTSSMIALIVANKAAQTQTVLPEIVVEAQRSAPPRTASAQTTNAGGAGASQNTQMDVARDNISPRFGASTFDMNRQFIETLPQGSDSPINKILLQAPGVSQDSAASGEIHGRNEH